MSWRDKVRQEVALKARKRLVAELARARASGLTDQDILELSALTGPTGQGRCGDEAPLLARPDFGGPVTCRLRHGHQGWHEAESGMEWTHGDDRSAIARVLALCDEWDGLSKGETPTTRRIRDALRL